MKKIDATVLNETAYIAAFTLIFSALMQAIFLVLGYWDYTVLLGNLLGFIAAVGNFLLMGLTVQAALDKDEKDVKNLMKLSQTMRVLLLFVIAIVAYAVPVFNVLAAVIPYLFPRFAIAFRPLIKKD